jgi:glycerol dehydrogenase
MVTNDALRSSEMSKNSTIIGFGSPSRYFQGHGQLDRLEFYTKGFGSKVLALIDPFFFTEMTTNLDRLYAAGDSTITTEAFKEEVTDREINRIKAAGAEKRAQVIVGIGGGKTLDAAKAVAHALNIPIIVVPTTASTDAPCSALSMVYKENGDYSHALWYPKNPDVVLVDLDIIIKAPIRFLIAGMGDALSTYFEARANQESDSPNYVNYENGGGYKRSRAAMAVAELSYKILLEDGLKAKIAAENGVCTRALENVIEANILLSGLGFENTACAGAHSIANGLNALPSSHETLHGEKVAFGVICQLVMENRPTKELHRVIDFCFSIGLPITLKELQVEANQENIRTIAEASMAFNWLSEPFPVTSDMVYDAILTTDQYVRHLKSTPR